MFTATLMRRWRTARNEETLFIEPGSPWENGYVESFNGKLRDELLDREIFYTLTEAKILIERWRREDNTVAAAPCVGLSTAGSGSHQPSVTERTDHEPRSRINTGSTLGARSVGCAVALRTLKIVRDENFPEQAATKGQYLINGLVAALGNHPNVGNIRGKGLMCAVELVEDRATKRPFSVADQIGPKVHPAAIDRGLFSRIKGDSYLLAPPIVTTTEQLDRIVESVTGAITDILG